MPVGQRTLRTTWPAGDPRGPAALTPREDVVAEVLVANDPGDDPQATTHASSDVVFRQAHGPFTQWERRVSTSPDGQIHEITSYGIEVPWFGWLYALAVAHTVRHRPPHGSMPWWAPPDRLDARTVRVLGLLAAAAMASAFTNTLFTQTVAFAADDFGVGNTGIGVAGSLVRAGIIITIPLAVAGDRIGRRRAVLIAAWSAPTITALGALAPNFGLLVATQAIGRPLGLAVDFLIAVIAAEEMPRNSRAHAVGLLALANGLGAGIAVAALPLADLGDAGWRWVYVVALIWLAVAVDLTRRLPETQRFVRPHARRTTIDRSRFAVLAAIAVGVNVLVAPASFFQNGYLDDERGYSASLIAVFTLCTATPAAVGLMIGGRAADSSGRRRVIASALPFAAAGVVASFAVGGPAMWGATFLGGLLGGIAYPAIAVYRTELFPTGARARASGLLTLVALVAGIVGLLSAGVLLDAGWSHGRVMALLALGQLLAVMMVWALPETAHRELEDLNDID